MKKIRIAMLFALVGLLSCTSDKGEVPVCDNVNSSYSQRVAPIIAAKCAITGCHTGGALYAGDLDTYEQVKAKVDNGSFKLRVIDLKVMPPASSTPLTADEYKILKCWCEAGAPDN